MTSFIPELVVPHKNDLLCCSSLMSHHNWCNFTFALLLNYFLKRCFFVQQAVGSSGDSRDANLQINGLLLPLSRRPVYHLIFFPIRISFFCPTERNRSAVSYKRIKKVNVHPGLLGLRMSGGKGPGRIRSPPAKQKVRLVCFSQQGCIKNK